MDAKMSVLVSGAGSGLGRECQLFFNATGFGRNTDWSVIEKQAHQKPFDLIIHSAFNTRQDITSATLPAYLADTLELTNRLLALPHAHFVFISSIDVYPKDDRLHDENEIIPIKAVDSIYGVAKLMCEALVQSKTKHHLILRPSALLGRFSKPNSLIKMLNDKTIQLSLAPNSLFNYVLHTDLCQFIQAYYQGDVPAGIYNFTVAHHVSLQEVAKLLQASPKFGAYEYQVGQVDNKKATSYFPKLSSSSLEIIGEFIKQRCEPFSIPA